MTHAHQAHTGGKSSHLLSVVSICIILAGLVLLYSNISSRNSTWYAAHMANGKIYFGHLRSSEGGMMVFMNPYRFDATKTAPSASPASSSPFSVQPIQNWYSITPISAADTVPLTDEGGIVIDSREVLFWGPLDANTELTQALIKANEGK